MPELNNLSQIGGNDFLLTVRIPAEEAKAWKAAAKRHGLALSEWISLSLSLSDRLSLIDGYQKTPAIGKRLDPVLARAILEAAQGQKWEHKAMLLLGMANEPEEVVEARRQRTKTRVPLQLIELFAEYGISYRERAPNYFSVLGQRVLSWQELAYVLTLWRDSQFDWCYLPKKVLMERTGATLADASKAVTRGVEQGLIEREVLDNENRNRRNAPSRMRVTREAGEAILRGDLRPATEDDAFMESFLVAESTIPGVSGEIKKVDPLLIQASRDVSARGEVTATAVHQRYRELQEEISQQPGPTRPRLVRDREQQPSR